MQNSPDLFQKDDGVNNTTDPNHLELWVQSSENGILNIVCESGPWNSFYLHFYLEYFDMNWI